MAEDRRYQVFVSSTFFDLKDERSAVVSALLQLDAFPAGMELFPATDDDSWTLIKRVIDSSDYYLLVIGGRYGSIDPATELSYTEMEYGYAIEREKPVMAFLHGQPDKIELGKSEVDAEAREKLEAFRDKVKGSKHVKFWTGADDLAGKVALSFGSFRNTYPAIGWMRGNVETSTEMLAENNALRKQVEALEHQIESARTEAPASAEGLAAGSEETGFWIVGYVRIEWPRIAGMSIMSEHRYEVVIDDEPLTWDDLFSTLGPIMLNEASEGALRDALRQSLSETYRSPAAEQALEMAEQDEVDGITKVEPSLSLSADDFGTLIVQLRGLGLMTKSEKPRSVKDTETYWTLTPYGDQHLTTLRAIPSGMTNADVIRLRSEQPEQLSGD